MRNIGLSISILLISFVSYAQQGSLKGKVTFEGNPEQFVNIIIKGTNKGVVTDENGYYELKNLPQGMNTLVVSYVGFKTQQKQIAITSNQVTTANFKLKEDVLGLDQVVVSATRRHLNRKLAPVIVTVTDSKALESVQAVSLSEGLSFQPGLRFETNCQNCGYSQVRINGLEGAYSQILVDSRPVFSALAGIYGLDQIPANTIDRVEVVRGGGSALYGSSAIAGTINIITKDPIQNTFQLSSNLGFIGGEKEDFSAAINGTVVSEDYDSGMSFFSSYRRRTSYDDNGDGYTEIPRLRNKSFGAKAFFKPNTRSRISAELTVLKEFRRGGNQLDLLPFQSGITEQIDSDVILGSLTYETANKAMTNRYSLYASGSLAENKNYYGVGADLPTSGTAEDIYKSFPFGTSKDKVMVLGGQLVHKFENDILTAGLEHKYNKTNDIKTALQRDIKQTLNTSGLYAQYEWIPSESFKVLAGLRADYYDVSNLSRKNISEFVVNPRLNVMYTSSDELRFRISYAKGYRAPQFFADDLHVAIAAGDIQQVQLADDLKAETSHSFTGSIDWAKNYEDGAQLSFTLEPFYTLLDKPFALDPLDTDETISVKTNGDNATILGANFEAKYAPNEQFVFQAGFTYQQSKYSENVEIGSSETNQMLYTKDFMRSPNMYGNFIFTYAPTRQFQNNLSGIFTGSMYVDHTLGEMTYNSQTIDEAHRIEETPNFFELNWKSSYDFALDKHEHLTLQLNGGVQNIFNSYQSDFDKGDGRDAAYIYGPSRPRTFFVGLKISGK